MISVNEDFEAIIHRLAEERFLYAALLGQLLVRNATFEWNVLNSLPFHEQTDSWEFAHNDRLVKPYFLRFLSQGNELCRTMCLVPKVPILIFASCTQSLPSFCNLGRKSREASSVGAAISEFYASVGVLCNDGKAGEVIGATKCSGWGFERQ